MMNHIVPDFETDEDFVIPEMPKKSAMGGDEDIMELLWHNGQVVMQSQNQRSATNKKPETRPSREIRSSIGEDEPRPSGMFMQEDEMASWLHYPIDDNPLENYLYNNDLIYPSSGPITGANTSLPPPPPPSVVIPPRAPVLPNRRVEGGSNQSIQQKYTNFTHFTKPGNKTRFPELGPEFNNSGPNSSKVTGNIVASNFKTVEKAMESRASRVSDKPGPVCVGNMGGGGSRSGVGGVSSAGRDMETCELSATSSPGSGGSGGSASVERLPEKVLLATDDRKRKGIEADDNDCHSEGMELEYADAKKQSHVGSTSTKRSRAAEVHNLSERRRRDRINEKMKALQELIPRCNKSDKASMLDEAIDYLKSLQMQVQMMSMGCNMVPMMFPGVQQYMPAPMAMGMGMGMGMPGIGMGMDMGMNRAIIPYPAILPGSSLPNPAAAAAAAAHLAPRFPVPGFNMPPVAVAGPTVSQAAHMSDPMMHPLTLNSQNQPRVPNFADPFQQHLGLHQTLPQNQGGVPPIATKPSNNKDAINPNHHQTR